MAGTQSGGFKAAENNLKRYGKDFYKRIGAKGGRATGMKGFAVNRALARSAGRIGGQRSSRSGVRNGQAYRRVGHLRVREG